MGNGVPWRKHQMIQPGYGEWVGWRETGGPNPTPETKLSGAKGHREDTFSSLFNWPRAALETIYRVDSQSTDESDDHTHCCFDVVLGEYLFVLKYIIALITPITTEWLYPAGGISQSVKYYHTCRTRKRCSAQFYFLLDLSIVCEAGLWNSLLPLQSQQTGSY